jgi:hypothetical protein
MKFEECYLKKNNERCALEVMVNIYKKSKEEYKEKYYNDMYCPECYDAQLSFYPNAKTPYFSTKSSSVKHAPNCSFNYEAATKKQLDEYYDKSGNYKI